MKSSELGAFFLSGCSFSANRILRFTVEPGYGTSLIDISRHRKRRKILRNEVKFRETAAGCLVWPQFSADSDHPCAATVEIHRLHGPVPTDLAVRSMTGKARREETPDCGLLCLAGVIQLPATSVKQPAQLRMGTEQPFAYITGHAVPPGYPALLTSGQIADGPLHRPESPNDSIGKPESEPFGTTHRRCAGRWSIQTNHGRLVLGWSSG